MSDLLNAYSKLLKGLSETISTDAQLRNIWRPFSQVLELSDSTGNLQITMKGYAALQYLTSPVDVMYRDINAIHTQLQRLILIFLRPSPSQNNT